MKTKYIFTVAFIASFYFVNNGFAQEEKPEKKGSYSLTMNVDNFLGFNVQFSGAYPINDRLDFVLIGTIFTSPNFGGKSGSAAATNANSTGLFTVIGPGVRYKFANGKAYIMPFIELANGALLSGGRFGNNINQLGQVADGLVPALGWGFKTGKFNTRFTGAYFIPAFVTSTETLELVRLTWTANYQLTKLVGVGVLYDHLWVQARPGNTSLQAFGQVYPYDDFLFLGPSVDFSFTKNAKTIFSCGPDLATPAAGTANGNGGRTFYRLSFNLTF